MYNLIIKNSKTRVRLPYAPRINKQINNIIDMTKQEALKALEEGKKITHRYFPEDQYFLKYLKEIRENHYSYI